MPLVKMIATDMAENIPPCVSVEDLVSEGTLGLLQAIDRYDQRRNDSIQAFARKRIRGAMLDFLRTIDWASRDTRRMLRRIEQARTRLTLNQIEQTDEAIAEAAGISVLAYRAIGGMINSAPASMSPANDDQREYQVADRARGPLHQAMDSRIRETIAGVLQHLPRRWARVLELYYFGELTMKQIGKELNVNESRVSQLHAHALEVCKEYLVKRQITPSRLIDSHQ